MYNMDTSNFTANFSRTRSTWASNSAREAFSLSSRDEDDEEALKWAALEKLPTYNRVRRGILVNGSGERMEINIEDLGMQDRKNLLERLVKVAEEDNERFLLKLKERMDRVGIEHPTIEVRFEDLKVSSEAYVGSSGIPTVLNFFSNTVESFLNYLNILPTRKRPITILHGVTGIVKPYRMTLLLGPPSSGKTTLLLALAGELDKKLQTSGRVTYNGHGMDEFVPQRTSAYISQHDLHIGELTVRETMAFSAKCQGVGTRYDMLTELSRRERAQNIKPDPDIDVFMKATSVEGQESVVTDYFLKILGLEICADIFVGDAMLRGISGGQRKRLTTGEMLVGPARALFMDEISTGLDSSTTYQIVNSIRQYIHILGGTALIGLLQPPPETYDLFDDIVLLSDGQIVYQGTREHVVPFFESMGFKCPERKGVADFLQEVTSRKDQKQYWARDEPYRFVSVKQFADAFLSFHVGRSLEEELRVPFDKSKNHPAALTTSRYGVSKKELLKACFEREFLLMKRNAFVFIFKFVQLLVVATIWMTVFLRVKMHKATVDDGTFYMGAMFIALTSHLFNTYAEMAMTIAKLPVFFKQRDLMFFPAWAYAIPTCVLKIPIYTVEPFIYTAMSYYVIGFDPNVQRFFRHFFIYALVSNMASGLFRCLAAVGRTRVIANILGSFAQVVLLVLGGFIISRKDIRKWWIWGYWCSPLSYAQNAISVNEFLGHSWDKPFNGSTLGIAVLETHGIFTEANWFWIGVAGLLGFFLFFNLLYTLSLTFLDPLGKGHAVISEEELLERHANRTGEGVELVSRVAGGRSQARRTAMEISNEQEDSNRKKGMVLPFVPLSLTFDNVKYAVDMPAEMRAQGVHDDKLVLLKGVSGAFRPGVLTALMGVSGAGKTTLMDVLAGRKTGGYIEGNISISGYPKKQETFTRISGYCEQNDIHSPNITVYESLLFSAWLRLPPEVNSATRKMFVEEVMELVELTPLRGALAGLPGVNGLSTEQRKRLTIAVELVANPSIIFMDEPTSGLDARAAAIVMRTVRNTVDTGRTVVCTIHQPSIDIFESFDELFLMKRGGEEIYVGPLGHNSSELIKYFEGINGVSKIKDGYNPATWMLEVSSLGQEHILGVDFAEIYRNSDLYRRNKELISELCIPPPGSKDLYFPTQYSQPFFAQCIACFWKQYKSYWRNPSYGSIRLLFTLLTALMLGTIFWRLGSRTTRQSDVFNALGSMLVSAMFIGVQNSNTVQPVVDVERTVFYREKAAGMYSALPYAFAQVAIEIPYTFIQTLLYACVVYSMMNYDWTAAKFLWFIYFTFMTFLYFTYYGMMVTALTPNSGIASVVATAFYGTWTLFAGLVLPRPRIPVWWRWFYWVCPIAWTLYGLLVSQFGDSENLMDSGETVRQFMKDFFGYRHDFVWPAAAGVLGFATVFAIIFAFAVKTLNFQKR